MKENKICDKTDGEIKSILYEMYIRECADDIDFEEFCSQKINEEIEKAINVCLLEDK